MFKSKAKIIMLALIFLAFSSCTTAQNTGPAPLRVGITPEFPPMIFLSGGWAAGVEVDLARLLGQKLKRPIQFVPVDWTDQIPALLARKTDIIMSSMTITTARKVRINFTDPYFKSGLLAMMRAEDTPKYKSREDVANSFATIGVVGGTTGDIFVRGNFPNSRTIALSKSGDAPSELKRRSIDFFVYDGPAIMWLVSQNEADFVAIKKPLNEEFLAWGVRRDDEALLATVNKILADWKRDGTLNRVLKRWLPYMDFFK
jgi:polar amino acid transport system substrate-binding protein